MYSCCCRFSETYSDNNVITSALPFAMNSEFSGALAKEMVKTPTLRWLSRLRHVGTRVRTNTHTFTRTRDLQRYYTDTALSLLPSPNQVRLERIGVRDLGKKCWLITLSTMIHLVNSNPISTPLSLKHWGGPGRVIWLEKRVYTWFN